jgi:hypothetical protein
MAPNISGRSDIPTARNPNIAMYIPGGGLLIDRNIPIEAPTPAPIVMSQTVDSEVTQDSSPT